MKKNTRVKLASDNHTDYIDKAYTMNQDLQEIIKFADDFIQFIERQEDNFSFLETYDDREGSILERESAFENIGELGLGAIDDAVDSINEIQETMQTLSDQLEDNVKAVEKYLDNNF